MMMHMPRVLVALTVFLVLMVLGSWLLRRDAGR